MERRVVEHCGWAPSAQGLPVETACRVLGVSSAGYYAWKNRPPSERTIRHAWLTDLVTEIHAASRQTYGSIRIHAEQKLGREGSRLGVIRWSW
jgi:putative transposase